MFGNKKKYPWNKARDENMNNNSGNDRSKAFANREDPAEMNDVYAAPEFFRGKPDPAEMMAVYAGPEYFSNNAVHSNAVPGVFVNMKEQSPSDTQALFCKNCGNQIKSSYKFCGYCGSKLEE